MSLYRVKVKRAQGLTQGFGVYTGVRIISTDGHVCLLGTVDNLNYDPSSLPFYEGRGYAVVSSGDVVILTRVIQLPAMDIDHLEVAYEIIQSSGQTYYVLLPPEKSWFEELFEEI